ncbi:unnamed protein product [Dovyalis caffra]|uniref:Protein ABIL5 n=1 Tax=Dovyalis caffra TaxID=77055 RepID=A0AAV1RQ89_9ROSI|nr:unnamed protein product [Dovyalis caffra]
MNAKLFKEITEHRSLTRLTIVKPRCKIHVSKLYSLMHPTNSNDLRINQLRSLRTVRYTNPYATQIAKISKSLSSQNSESHESQDVIRFDKSLQELRDLRSQLHYAANYCETTFLNTKHKKKVVENTKEYLSRAVVAVVDHLGCVSANLNSSISKNSEFSEAELRINCLKQVTITSVEKSNEDVRDSNSQVSTKVPLNKQAGDLPLFLHTCTQKSTSTKNLWSATSTEKGDTKLVLPVRDGLSILSRNPNPTFHFQQCSPKHGRSTLIRKSSPHTNDLLSLIRRSKRAT